MYSIIPVKMRTLIYDDKMFGGSCGMKFYEHENQ